MAVAGMARQQRLIWATGYELGLRLSPTSPEGASPQQQAQERVNMLPVQYIFRRFVVCSSSGSHTTSHVRTGEV